MWLDLLNNTFSQMDLELKEMEEHSFQTSENLPVTFYIYAFSLP